jgi:hypothetical protein
VVEIDTSTGKATAIRRLMLDEAGLAALEGSEDKTTSSQASVDPA